jgi:hypothetical protein
MSDSQEISLAVKCAPNEKILIDIEKVGIPTVQIYIRFCTFS